MDRLNSALDNVPRSTWSPGMAPLRSSLNRNSIRQRTASKMVRVLEPDTKTENSSILPGLDALQVASFVTEAGMDSMRISTRSFAISLDTPTSDHSPRRARFALDEQSDEPAATLSATSNDLLPKTSSTSRWTDGVFASASAPSVSTAFPTVPLSSGSGSAASPVPSIAGTTLTHRPMGAVTAFGAPVITIPVFNGAHRATKRRQGRDVRGLSLRPDVGANDAGVTDSVLHQLRRPSLSDSTTHDDDDDADADVIGADQGGTGPPRRREDHGSDSGEADHLLRPPSPASSLPQSQIAHIAPESVSVSVAVGAVSSTALSTGYTMGTAVVSAPPTCPQGRSLWAADGAVLYDAPPDDAYSYDIAARGVDHWLPLGHEGSYLGRDGAIGAMDSGVEAARDLSTIVYRTWIAPTPAAPTMSAPRPGEPRCVVRAAGGADSQGVCSNTHCPACSTRPRMATNAIPDDMSVQSHPSKRGMDLRHDASQVAATTRHAVDGLADLIAQLQAVLPPEDVALAYEAAAAADLH